ncbi:hypothetical protein UA08_06498 [Talaromyces atroroseus]|uniref:Uncharacterized protein n=1 Tax=Talaromyces atroroseus TaxID=1441469 RepID=A0A225AFT0_TALAT|nr:hypothetical protein UA08_06498 [Talaromyces atroroseus]OKL57993.1 hypothetical protein UA08_06498 [Talaromyces atroroseus]
MSLCLRSPLVARLSGSSWEKRPTAFPTMLAIRPNHTTSSSMRKFTQKSLQDPKLSFAGRTILVTGANSGLGFEAASKFTVLGASRVILGVRSLEKGAETQNFIEKRTGKLGIVEPWHLDMNDYGSVRNFATHASTELDQLDIVVLNAGVFSVNYRPSLYGWEETLQVNLLSTAYLALLILPKLRASPHTSLLEFVSSRRHEVLNISDEQKIAPNLLEKFNSPSNFKSSQQYQVSKRFLICFMQALASLVNPTYDGVTIMAVCPGYCQSNLSRGHTGISAAILRGLLNTFVLRTAEQGSRTFVSGAALGPEAHGKFWYDDGIHETSANPASGPDEDQFKWRVWKEIVEALEKDLPEITNSVKLLEETKA